MKTSILILTAVLVLGATAKPASILKTVKVGQTVAFDLTVGAGPPTVTALRAR